VITSKSNEKITKKQIEALKQQRDWIFEQLEPDKLKRQALIADTERAMNQRALQEQLDPKLAEARYEAESKILEGLKGLGADSDAMRLGGVAAREAETGIPGMDEVKSRLVDAALSELDAGATLPPDVQAELVKAGLEQGGMVTGAASPHGIGGQLVRELLGSAGLQLKQQRQQQAAGLANQAQNLETSRQNILQQLFPSLANVQLGQLGGAQDAIKNIEAFTPQAGLTGEDITNLWLQRVGATGQLDRAAAEAASRGALANSQIWNQAIGSAMPLLTNSLPKLSSLWGGGNTGSSSGFTNFSPAPYGGGSSYG